MTDKSVHSIFRRFDIHQSLRLNNDATYHAYQKSCPLVGAESQTTTIAFDKVMYSRDIQYLYLKKSCIHATYHKSRHYLTLMTVHAEMGISFTVSMVSNQQT